jgi:Ca2+-binding EF-hand superfamily protein
MHRNSDPPSNSDSRSLSLRSSLTSNLFTVPTNIKPSRSSGPVPPSISSSLSSPNSLRRRSARKSGHLPLSKASPHGQNENKFDYSLVVSPPIQQSSSLISSSSPSLPPDLISKCRKVFQLLADSHSNHIEASSLSSFLIHKLGANVSHHSLTQSLVQINNQLNELNNPSSNFNPLSPSANQSSSSISFDNFCKIIRLPASSFPRSTSTLDKFHCFEKSLNVIDPTNNINNIDEPRRSFSISDTHIDSDMISTNALSTDQTPLSFSSLLSLHNKSPIINLPILRSRLQLSKDPSNLTIEEQQSLFNFLRDYKDQSTKVLLNPNDPKNKININNTSTAIDTSDVIEAFQSNLPQSVNLQ